MDAALSVNYTAQNTPEEFQQYNPQIWSIKFAREVCRQFLQGLDALYSQNISHRDLHPDNMILGLSYELNDLSMTQIQADMWDADSDLEDTSRDWKAKNLEGSDDWIEQVKRLDNQPLQPTEIRYVVEPFPLHDKVIINKQDFRIVITDLGFARKFDYQDRPMTAIQNYRAPEAVLPLDEKPPKTDIFSAGLVIWEIVMLRNMIWTHSIENKTTKEWDPDNDQYLKDLEARIGPMPPAFQKLWTYRKDMKEEERGEDDLAYGDMNFAAHRDRPDDMSDAEVKVFVSFMLEAMQWEPEKRPNASQLLNHEWFQTAW